MQAGPHWFGSEQTDEAQLHKLRRRNQCEGSCPRGTSRAEVSSNARRGIDARKRAAYTRQQERTHLVFRRRIYPKVRRALTTRQ